MLPTWHDAENQAFYEDLFRECRRHGIEPMVTIVHFDCPLGLIEKYGSWRNRKMIGFYLNLCRTLFARFKGLVRYWLTFNEINMLMHVPFTAGGVRIEEGENAERVKYTAAHHELVASALATKMAREIDPENLVGCMMAGGDYYPYTCNPADVWKGIELPVEEGDLEVLRDNTVDFVSFSYYLSRVASADPTVTGTTGGNVYNTLPNPYLPSRHPDHFEEKTAALMDHALPIYAQSEADAQTIAA